MPVGVVFHDTRDWLLIILIDILNIVVLLSIVLLHEGTPWTHGASNSIGVCLSMESFNLELTKLDIEVLNEVFEHISTLAHEFSRLLVSEDFVDKFVWTLKVGEQQDEDFLRISRYLYEVD